MWKCFLGKRIPMFFMRWKHFTEVLAQFTFDGIFGFFFGGGECFVFQSVTHDFCTKTQKVFQLVVTFFVTFFFDSIKVNREYLTFISQIQNLIWLFPNKSSVWLYGKQLQLSCKTHIQIVFKIVLKKQCLRQSHNAKTTYCPSKTKILVNFFYVYTHTYISPKDWVRFFTKEHILRTA